MSATVEQHATRAPEADGACALAGEGGAPAGAAVRAARVLLLLVVAALPLVPMAWVGHAVTQALFAALAATGGLLLWIDAARGRPAPSLSTPTDLALLAWLAVSLPAAALAANAGAARLHLLQHLGLGLTYVLAVKTLRTPRDVRAVLLAALLPAVVTSVAGLLAQRRFVADAAPESARAAYLATPFFAHSYLAAQLVVIVLAGGLVLLFERGVRPLARAALALALLPQAAFLAVVGSRGAWLAVLVAVPAVGWLRARAVTGGRGRLGRVLAALGRLAVLAVLGGVLLVLATISGLLEPGAGSHVLDRMLLLFDPQASAHNLSRLRVWTATVQLAAEHPLLGVGPGNFGAVFQAWFASPRVVTHAHNQFLHVLAETGLLGLFAFLFVLRAARRAAGRGARHLMDDPQRRGAFLAATAGLLAGLTWFLFETPLEWIEAGSLLVVLLAVMTRAGCLSRDAVPPRALASGALLLALGVLAVTVPALVGYTRALALEQEAQRVWRAVGPGSPVFHDESAAARARREAGGERALELLAASEAAFPYTEGIATTAADICIHLGRLEEALAWRLLADERQPGAFRHLSVIGQLLMTLNRPEEALAPLRAAMVAHQGVGSEPTYSLLARAYSRAGRHEEAWYIWSDLVLLHAWHHVDSAILLDAAGTMLMLQRSPTFAGVLLDEYARLHPDAPSQERYAELRDRADRQLARPGRRVRHGPGPEAGRVVLPWEPEAR